MADRSAAFFGDSEPGDVPEPVLAPERTDALDPGVSAVLTALDGCTLAYQLDVLESTLAAVRAAFEVGMVLPPETFLALRMDTEFN
jgi:hypothetical protein